MISNRMILCHMNVYITGTFISASNCSIPPQGNQPLGGVYPNK